MPHLSQHNPPFLLQLQTHADTAPPLPPPHPHPHPTSTPQKTITTQSKTEHSPRVLQELVHQLKARAQAAVGHGEVEVHDHPLLVAVEHAVDEVGDAEDLDLLARKLAGLDLHITATTLATEPAAAAVPAGAPDNDTAAATTLKPANPDSYSHPHLHPYPQLQPQPQPHSHHTNEPPHLPCLGPPVHVLAKAGDVLLLHPDLAHAGGPNRTDTIRKMVYFRIRSRGLGLREKGGKGGGSRADEQGGCTERGDCLDQRRPPDAGQGGEQVTRDKGEEGARGAWERVCEAHGRDMWVDLPGVRAALDHLHHTVCRK